jgi:hypothetical protein
VDLHIINVYWYITQESILVRLYTEIIRLRSYFAKNPFNIVTIKGVE